MTPVVTGRRSWTADRCWAADRGLDPRQLSL